MNTCIYCNKKIKVNFLNILFPNSFCIKCFEKLKVLNITKNLNGINCLVLFEYNEFAKNFLYQYKEQGDVVICTLFKDYLNYYIKRNYDINNTTFTVISSSSNNYQKRGFNQVYELLDLVSGITISSGPKRLDNIRQGKLTIKQRKLQVHNFEPVNIRKSKKLVIVDDVITTGTTLANFYKSINNIEEFSEVEFLVLFGSKKL